MRKVSVFLSATLLLSVAISLWLWGELSAKRKLLDNLQAQIDSSHAAPCGATHAALPAVYSTTSSAGARRL